MPVYEMPYEADAIAQSQRNYDEAKLTYAEYHGDIPTDDDIADYVTPLKGVRLA